MFTDPMTVNVFVLIRPLNIETTKIKEFYILFTVLFSSRLKWHRIL